MTPLAKSYLHTYLNNATNVTVISEFVESVLAVARTEKDRKLVITDYIRKSQDKSIGGEGSHGLLPEFETLDREWSQGGR
jgi:hypothetical protein